MQFLIVAAIACLIFAGCFVVLLFKGRKADTPVNFHMCGHAAGDDCRCKKKQSL